ncbi:MAG: hypothetical protein LHW64_00895 [Candidatus Cloacimonetes bacterium]|jgi:hypothetical protein|nr:hypothetical protein [Candidatus Cloacimonadota bacterium]MCB5286344.1 hypothetical protein [Candidatus Cloacimonadota bacterium]MCK9184055.1 hypothetical protein [Candidatus Cloacimonadota bacterium]MDY0228666.1 hypothetical protein [Candidatus Cloacimonadaceae bacterium]
MDALKNLEKKLTVTSKFDRLAVFCGILQLKCKQQLAILVKTYLQARSAYQDYMEFDPQAPLSMRNYMTEVFFQTYPAIRPYLRGKDFGKILPGSYRCNTEAISHNCIDYMVFEAFTAANYFLYITFHYFSSL